MATIIQGQILFIRKKSRRLAFADLLTLDSFEQERIELIIKPVFEDKYDNNDNNNDNITKLNHDIDKNCGVADVSDWLKAVCVGDYVKICGQFENSNNRKINNHIKAFRVQGTVPTIIKEWKKYNKNPFVPPVMQYNTSSSINNNISSLNGNHFKNLCKYFTTTKSCPKGDLCRFVHSTDKNDRQEWVKQRKAAKLINGRIKNDTIPIHKKKSKGARADVFASFIVHKFGGVDVINRNGGVLDVAGGRGDLSFELKSKYNIKCTLIDPRIRKLNKKQRRYILKSEKDKKRQHQRPENIIHVINGDNEPKCKKQKMTSSNNIFNQSQQQQQNTKKKKLVIDDQLLNDYLGQHIQGKFDSSFKIATIGGAKPLVVGMHPDQATEDIVDIALEHKLNFAVVPCCVFPKPLFEKNAKERKKAIKMSFDEWCKYLSNKADGIESDFLNFTGANRVIYKIF